MDVFCERCGKPQPKPDTTGQRSAGFLARRVLDAVGITENQPTPTEDWLRLCLSCRGYSCPTCWNDLAGVCQTCEPTPEPIVVVLPEPVALPEPVVLPAPVALPEPVATEPAPQPIPYWVTQLEPLVAPRDPEAIEILEDEPIFVAEAEPVPAGEPEPEPVVVAQSELEPEPEPVVVAEPEPEPVVVAEPEPAPAPIERPTLPRMPILPLPRPRPADAPLIPLAPLPDYPTPPQIAFTPAVATTTVATTSPAYEAHMLVAPPPQLSPSAIAAGLRPCSKCHLTLSARAHFCRRCGTAQAA